GQARVPGGSGIWKDLTETVNLMANNLTSQVRNIAEGATAVTRGDLNLKIDGDAAGEDLELQDYINTMIGRLRETTLANEAPAAVEKRTLLVENVPPGYLRIASGLGEAPPAHVIVLPLLFEDRNLGVIELASFQPFTQIQKDFLNQIAEMIATSVNTISVNTKTEGLLAQSQELTAQLRERSAELENRQKALQASNAELE